MPEPIDAKCVHCQAGLVLSIVGGNPILIHNDSFIHCGAYTLPTMATIRVEDIPRLLGDLLQLEVELR